MNRTAWIIIVAVCVLGLGGLIVFTKKDSINVDSIDPAKVITATNGAIGDRVYGKADSKVVVIEYADYQCPGCAGAYQNFNAIKKLYSEKVAFVFRNFPLTTIHPNSLAASSVAEAAGQQGKFWDMHDTLFGNRDAWVNLSVNDRSSAFLGYANQLKLNVTTFNSDLAGKMVADKIARDRALGNKLGVNSTPSFFIGNKEADSETVNDIIQQGGTKLMDAIDAALKNVGETPPARS